MFCYRKNKPGMTFWPEYVAHVRLSPLTYLCVALSRLRKWTLLSSPWKNSAARPQRAPPTPAWDESKAWSSCPAREEAPGHGHLPRNILNSVNCKNTHTSQPD